MSMIVYRYKLLLSKYSGYDWLIKQIMTYKAIKKIKQEIIESIK